MRTREPERKRYPLSSAQRRLWFLAQLNPQSCAYNNAHLIHISGPLDGPRLIASLHAVIERHHTLRMRFVTADGPGSDVIAVVDAVSPIVVTIQQFGDLSAEESGATGERFVRELAHQPFDLEAGPLLRAGLLSFGANRHTLAIVVHHIVSDRWSFGILMRELAALYAHPCGDGSAILPPLQLSYGEIARAEAAHIDVADAHLDYWRSMLDGERPVLDLPADRARPHVSSDRGAVVATTFAADLIRRVSRVGAERRATPFMTFFAAFCVLLSRSTGQTDMVVGIPVAGRSRVEREPLIGLFVNTLPVRVRAQSEQCFGDVLATVRAATLGMLAHADVPFDRLVREELAPREGGRNPFFDVLFNFHNTPAAAAWPGELEVRTEDADLGTARIDLAAVLRPNPDGSMSVRFEFCTDLFDRATIETFVAHFAALLENIASAPDIPIRQLAIATEAECATIVDVWSRADATAPVAPPGSAQTIDALVTLTAARYPNAIALIEDGAPPLTYAELDRRANRLAHALRAQGIDRDARVGLYLERSVDAVVAMLGTLKAGAAYVPLDPAYPPERTASMLTSAGVAAILARRERFAELSPHARPLLDVDAAAHAPFDESQAPRVPDDPDRLAYVIFTSGSTGTPKAVGIAHRGVVALLTRTPITACAPEDAVLLHAALTFDASVYLWAPLVSGARVVVMPARPFSLGEFDEQLAKHRITVVELSAPLFHELVEERIDCLRGLRRCLVGGDVLSPALSMRFVREIRGCRLFNAYGPTETTVQATCHEVVPDAVSRHAVPIGRPIADARVYILDAEQRPVPIGVAGELWIGGPGVARGYINDPELTALRFVPDTFASESGARRYRSGDRARWIASGEIEFLGRLDTQMKIRGFRIEPAEIEFALLEHSAVRHAALAIQGHSAAQRYLVAFVELRTAGVDAAELRAFLHAKLPAHAIPARIVVLDALPKTSSGKIDRAALPEVTAGEGGTAARSAVTELQFALIRIWQKLLGQQAIGIDDNFFALGGHSLLATRLIGEIEREFGTRLPLAELFEHPTIEHLADVLQRDPANLNRSPLVVLNAAGTAPPLFFLHGSIAGGGYYCLGLAQRLGADQPLYAMRPHGTDGGTIPPAIETIAADCIDIFKSVRPHGPYLIGGFCSGGLVAFEIARQLVARGERVDNVILVDAPSAEANLRATVNAIGRIARYAGIPPAVRSAQRARISRFARSVRSYTATYGKRALLRRFGVKARAALDTARFLARGTRRSGATPTVPRNLMETWRWIGDGYVARTYTGRVTILLSEEYRRRSDVHAHTWPAVAPRAAVHAIPGEHLTCITDHISTTAKVIADALAHATPSSSHGAD